MKISKLLNVPFHAHGKGVIDSNATEWYFQVESIEAAEAICHAVNNHDKLVELVAMVAKSDTRTHAHKHVAQLILKGLGHEI